MRAASAPPHRPFLRPPVWIAAGFAGLVFFIAAVSRFGQNREPIAEKASSISESVALPAGKTADAAPPFPLSDERAAEPALRTGTDAADFYKDAFALFDALTEEEKKMLARPTEEVDAEAARALFGKIQPIMELLRHAAAADYCDWGFGPIDFESPLPHLGKAQNLAKVALWNAAYRFPSEAAGAIGDLAARARLGHDVAETVIGLLMEASFDKSANHLLRQNAASLDAAAAEQARAFLAGSTLDGDIARAMQTEASGSRAMLEKLAAQSAGERVQFAAAYGLNSENAGADDRAAAQRVEEILRDSAQLKVEMEFLKQTQTEMIEAMTWPGDRFRAWSQEIQAKAREHPLAAVSLPVFEGIHARLEEARVQRAMLGAGLDVLQNGTASLAQARDPVTGRGFAYVPKPGGFELQSAFQVKGKPVTMNFAKPE